MGRELRFRGVETPATIWSAMGLIEAPEVVHQIHLDYITAGADIITTNTYGVIRSDLAKEGIEDRFAELNLLACSLAREASENTDRSILVAGSLPPLRGSYRSDLVGESEEIEPLYREQAALLAPYVDLILCETMSSAAEGRAAARAACQTGKPVWVSWTLDEDQSGRLRSGETVAEAVEAIAELPVTGFLANCCAPESITKAMPELTLTGMQNVGGYANTFFPIPEDWAIDGHKETDGLLPLRTDLGPDQYAEHVVDWIASGATVVGGCCGTRPEHIARVHEILKGELNDL